MIQKQLLLLSMFCLLASSRAIAEVHLPHVFSSHMIFQQGVAIPVWGSAERGERIVVKWANTKLTTRADANGRWSVKLPVQQANAKPQTLTVAGKRNSITLDNIVVGEVWLCSGQSNMEYTLQLNRSFAKPARGADSAAIELTRPVNPMIRVLYVERKRSLPDCTTQGWKEASAESLPQVSAPAYFFAKRMLEELQVPIGIISTSWGGTRIETWTDTAYYQQSPLFKEEYQATGRIDHSLPAENYNSMIRPLAPFPVKGFLWYQGESNCASLDKRYAEKFELLVDNWRTLFNSPNAPFYSVLIAPHTYSDRLHGGRYALTAEELPQFWIQQQATLRIPHTDLVVISDLVDDLYDIHPSYKWEVGARFARLALANDYGKSEVSCRSPRFESVEAVGDSLAIRFSDIAAGLATSDKRRVSWFELAGADGRFRPAIAWISGEEVRAYHPEIEQPQWVRFGWHETAMPNLINSAGLPAFPFGAQSVAK